MRGWGTAIILIFFLIPGPAGSEIYTWVDDQGVQYFTTTLESIPEPYRSKAQWLPTPVSPPAPPEMTPSPPQKRPIKIPFTAGSAVTVSAKINGAGPITLILDTGSDRTLVAPSALRRLGILRVVSEEPGVMGITSVVFLSGFSRSIGIPPMFHFKLVLCT